MISSLSDRYTMKFAVSGRSYLDDGGANSLDDSSYDDNPNSYLANDVNGAKR